jgi:hypothetical protein
MDLILSLMPIHLIRTLNRSISERILICVLMGLGLIATAISCLKMTTFNDFGKGDPMQATIRPSMYAKLEEVIIIIVSSLPCLKQPAEQALRKLGILKEHQLTRPSFVNSISIPDIGKDGSDSNGSLQGAKNDYRIDSVALAPGSSSSAAEV